MKFVKTAETSWAAPRIVLFAGEGLEQYRFWTGRDHEKHKLLDETRWWTGVLNRDRQGYRSADLLFPEQDKSERLAINNIFREISKTLCAPNAVLSIVTHSSSVARETIRILVGMGLSRELHVVWFDQERRIHRGWFVDQDTPVGTEDFEVALAIDDEFLRKLAFTPDATPVSN